MLTEEFSEIIVEGIQQGLKKAKMAKIENGDRFDNAERFRIIDEMMNSLYYKLCANEVLSVKEFYRYSYKLLLVYNKEDHTLYSFMSEDRLAALINSKNIKDKQNYIFALMKFNPADRQQQVLIDGMDELLDEQVKIQERIREIIEEDGEIKYVTILYKKQGYSLLSVRAVKMSQYAEVLDIKDLSDYITVDYGEIYEHTINSREESLPDVEFNFKPGILTQNSGLDIEKEEDDIKEEK